MPVAKPTTLPRWMNAVTALDPTKTVEPMETKKDTGWLPGEQPPAQFLNWLGWWLYRWTEWLNDLTNQSLTWTAHHFFQAAITVNQTVVPNGSASSFFGNGLGRGVEATGGSSSGTGINCGGGGPNGVGIQAAGIGTGIGAVISGGSASASGLDVSGGTNAPALRGFGVGTGAGLRGIGGSSSGAGVQGFGGASNGNGLEGTAAGTGAALDCKVGGVRFTGTQPTASSDPGQNVLWALLGIRAWGYVTTNGAGSVTLADGANIASVTINASQFTVNLTRACANTNYCVLAITNNQAATFVVEDNNAGAVRTTSSFRLQQYDATGLGVVTRNPQTTVSRVCFIVLGRQ